MFFKKVVILISVLCLTFCLCSCGGEQDSDIKQPETSKNSAPKIEVTVTDTDGNAIEGVVLQIRKDKRVTARTNKEGKATFPLVPINGYKLSVLSIPDGYKYTGQTEIYIRHGVSEYIIQLIKSRR